MPSIAKKTLLWKKFKIHLFSFFLKTKTTQTSGSVFAERIEKIKKNKFELELMKIVHCFLDGHGYYDSNLVPFRIKPLKHTIFLLQLARVMSAPKEYKMLVENEIPKQKISSLV